MPKNKYRIKLWDGSVELHDAHFHEVIDGWFMLYNQSHTSVAAFWQPLSVKVN